jgi:hypothetical protein
MKRDDFVVGRKYTFKGIEAQLICALVDPRFVVMEYLANILSNRYWIVNDPNNWTPVSRKLKVHTRLSKTGKSVLSWVESEAGYEPAKEDTKRFNLPYADIEIEVYE